MANQLLHYFSVLSFSSFIVFSNYFAFPFFFLFSSIHLSTFLSIGLISSVVYGSLSSGVFTDVSIDGIRWSVLLGMRGS